MEYLILEDTVFIDDSGYPFSEFMNVSLFGFFLSINGILLSFIDMNDILEFFILSCKEFDFLLHIFMGFSQM